LDGLAQAEASKRHGGILQGWLTNDSEDEPMKEDTTNQSATIPAACTVIAVDLAKRVFQVAGEDALGCVNNHL
jgi:hypothetical protein